MIVTLESYEDEMAVIVGTRRHYANVGKGNRISYDTKRLQSNNWLASVDACRAEVGVAKAYGGFWNGSIWHRTDHHLHASEPDVLVGSIGLEVKRKRTAKAMPIDRKDAEANRLVVWAKVAEIDAEYEHPRIWIIGQVWAKEAWDETAEPYFGDPNRRAIPQEQLDKPALLNVTTPHPDFP